eukprot:4423789-Prymnesium_polylepis.1
MAASASHGVWPKHGCGRVRSLRKIHAGRSWNSFDRVMSVGLSGICSREAGSSIPTRTDDPGFSQSGSP